MFSLFKKKNVVPVSDTELRQILQSENCDQCSRNCILADVKCGRGKRQAKSMMNSYANQKNSKSN